MRLGIRTIMVLNGILTFRTSWDGLKLRLPVVAPARARDIEGPLSVMSLYDSSNCLVVFVHTRNDSFEMPAIVEVSDSCKIWSAGAKEKGFERIASALQKNDLGV